MSLHDVLIDPRTSRVVEAIPRQRWQEKWAEILMMHFSPHDVWVVHSNWSYLPDGEHIIYHRERGPMKITVRNGHRLIRNHRAYWKKYVVPHFFSEEQWGFLCGYHKEEWRFEFTRASPLEIQKRYHHFRSDTQLAECLGTMRDGITHRMDCWNWGSGDVSDFVPLRVDGDVAIGDKFNLDWLSRDTMEAAHDRSVPIMPRYHKIVTEKVLT